MRNANENVVSLAEFRNRKETDAFLALLAACPPEAFESRAIEPDPEWWEFAVLIGIPFVAGALGGAAVVWFFA